MIRRETVLVILGCTALVTLAIVVGLAAASSRMRERTPPFVSIVTGSGVVSVYRQCIDGNLYLIAAGATGIAMTAIPPTPRPCATLTAEAP